MIDYTMVSVIMMIIICYGKCIIMIDYTKYN